MKLTSKLLVIAGCLLANSSFAQVKMPAPSTGQTIVQDFGLGKLTLSYSRPNIKNRVPFKKNGVIAPQDKVWRTGANAATTLTVSDEIIINGVTLKAGKYGVLSIPQDDKFAFIITSDTTVNNPAAYKPSNDLVRVYSPYIKQSIPDETLSFQFTDVQREQCNLQLSWGKYKVLLPISTQIKSRIAAQLTIALQADKVTANTYQQAANFYFDWEVDLPRALQYATKATEANSKAFWLFLLKAKIEAAMGDKIAARNDANQCKSLATEQKNDDYVKQATDLIAML